MSLFCRYGLHQANQKKLYVCFVIASQCRCELEYTLSSPSSKYTRSMSVTHKPTAWDAQLPPNYAVRVIVYFGWRLKACLKPLCSINHRPCLNTLPIRKVRAPFHRIIQLHQKRFVLLVNVLDTSNEKWQILALRKSTFPMSPERLASWRRWDDDRALLIATQQSYRASMPTTYHYIDWPNK